MANWVKTTNGSYVNLDLAYNLYINQSEEEGHEESEWEVLAKFLIPTGEYRAGEEDAEGSVFEINSDIEIIKTFKSEKEAQEFLDRLISN